MRVPWTARRSNQSILNETSPECSREGLTLELKLQDFGRLYSPIVSPSVCREVMGPEARNLTHGKSPWRWERLRVGGEGGARG